MRKAGMLVEIQCLFELLNRLVGLPRDVKHHPQVQPGIRRHRIKAGRSRCDRQRFGGPPRVCQIERIGPQGGDIVRAPAGSLLEMSFRFPPIPVVVAKDCRERSVGLGKGVFELRAFSGGLAGQLMRSAIGISE